jgi:hypothetical protein
MHVRITFSHRHDNTKKRYVFEDNISQWNPQIMVGTAWSMPRPHVYIHVHMTSGHQNNESTCPDHISKIMSVHAQHRPYKGMTSTIITRDQRT